jgi:uncharacterized protein YnzC (UPF0291/DUF896 family)
MDSLQRCRIILGISEDNTAKIALLTVYLEKAREDIEAFCRDTFINDEGKDVFPRQLKNVQEDIVVYRYRKRGAEGNSSYTLADESVSFDSEIPEDQKKKLYPFVRLFPNRNERSELV